MSNLSRSEETRTSRPGTTFTVTKSLSISLLDCGFHGPFPPSREEGEDGENAKKFVLCLIDSTSMFPELVAVKDTSATTLIRALFENVVAHYGVPRGISLQ
jgi:hypothetical protein